MSIPQVEGNESFVVTSPTLLFIYSKDLHGGLYHEDSYEHI